jgi:outer membrane protein TolC
MTVAAVLVALLLLCGRAWAQSAGSGYDPLSNTIATPHPINPAANTTNPGALAAQQQNPFLGSVSSCRLKGIPARLSLNDAIACGLGYNLGLIDSREGSANARASRMHALSVLLPQISANAHEVLAKYSAIPMGAEKLNLPLTVGPFNYQYTGFTASDNLLDLRAKREAQSATEAYKASSAALSDARDIVVLAAGSAYLQVVASKARVRAVLAKRDAMAVFDDFTVQRVREKVSPEIDGIRSQVARQTADERVTVAEAGLAKDKLTLARVVGLPQGQDFDISDDLPYQKLPEPDLSVAIQTTLELRSDLRSAAARMHAAEFSVHAASDERFPTLALEADYGAIGINSGNLHQTYSVAGTINMPLFTGRRIESNIAAANAVLRQRRAEYEDLKGRVEYDVRNSLLDLRSSDSSVVVADHNRELAKRGLSDVRERFRVGASTSLEVVQAIQATADAEDNYINSLFGYNVAKLDLARAEGVAATNYFAFLKGN